MLALTPEQVFYVTTTATVLIEILKFILKKKKDIKLTKFKVTLIIYPMAMIMAYFFLAPTIPASTDLMTITGAVLQAALSVFAFATLVYNLLLDKVITGLGNWIEKIKAVNNGIE